MTLTIELTPEQEARLKANASAHGKPVEVYLQSVIEQLPVAPMTATELLRAWREEGDEREQRETFAALKEGLNANHSSARKIYP